MDNQALGFGVLLLVLIGMPLVGAILLNFATLNTRTKNTQYRITVKYPLIILAVSLLCFTAGVFLQETLQNDYNFYIYGFLLLIIVILLVSITGSFYNFKKKTQDNSSIGVVKERSTPKKESFSLIVKFIVAKIKEIHLEFRIYFTLMLMLFIYITVSEEVSGLFSSVESINDLLNFEREMIFDLMKNMLQLIVFAVILFGLFKKRVK